MSRRFSVGNFYVGQGEPLALIAGPCVIEGYDITLQIAETLHALSQKYKMPLIFKACYDKANRSSYESFRGVGMDEGLRILEEVQNSFQIPVVTDVHSPEEAKAAASVCDMLQIPALLCRQTDLVVAVGQTQAAVNVKKGQFLSPQEMGNVVAKIHQTGNQRIVLTERGTCFGYHLLVNDFRSLPIMQQLGCPVCFDATHSVQLPGGLGTMSGGQKQYIPTLAKAGVAAGADLLFLEVHPCPEKAKSDGAIALSLETLEQILPLIHQISQIVREALPV